MIDKIELFVFVLSIFFNITLIFKMVRNLLKTPPETMLLDWREKLIWGMSISYIITYITL